MNDEKVIDRVRVAVSGLPYDVHVSGFELYAAVNAIPSISLEVLPKDIKPSEDNVSASSPKFSDVTKMFKDLSDAATERFSGIGSETKASVSIEVERSDGTSEKVELKDWVLTDVALTTVTTVSAPSLTVVLKHPVEVLDRVGEIYEDILAGNPMSVLHEASLPDDMLGIMDATYSLFADGSKITYYEPFDISGTKSVSDKVKKFRENITKALPSKFLTGKGGLFLGNSVGADDGRAKSVLKVAIATVFANNFGSSIWRTLVQSACPSCLLQVIPEYDQDKLVIGPYSPWEGSSYAIEGRVIEGIDMTSQDTDPLCGITMVNNCLDYPASTDNGAVHYDNQDKSDKPKSSRTTFFIPEKAECGRIEQIAENWVIAATRDINPSVMTSDAEISKLKDVITRSIYLNMCVAYAKGMFGCLYRLSCRSTVTTTLSFSDGEKTIYPGNVVDIKIGDDKKTVVRGYLASVTLCGSTYGNCTATYELIHARPDGAGKLLIDEGTGNPCYGK